MSTRPSKFLGAFLKRWQQLIVDSIPEGTVQSRFRPNVCGLGAFVVARGSRLLPHLASDEARNDPGIDLFTSFAVVDAIRLDYRPLPV